MGEVHCFACGQPGHLRAECKDRARTRRTEAPAPDAAEAAPEKTRIEGLDYNPPEKRAQDVPGWASKAREALEARGCVINAAEYRERRLRRMAAEQLAEVRADRSKGT